MVSPASGQPLKSPAKGYALIEVMISLVIVSVGLLGIAKMFALALGNTQVSGSRALAAIYAGSLSSAMHANRAFWQKGLAPASVTVTVTPTTTASLSDSTLNSQTALCSYDATKSPNPYCNPAELASADLKTWGNSLKPLPGGTGQVNCTTVTSVPITCTITITWNEKYAGLNTSTLDASQQRATKTLTTVVQP